MVKRHRLVFGDGSRTSERVKRGFLVRAKEKAGPAWDSLQSPQAIRLAASYGREIHRVIRACRKKVCPTDTATFDKRRTGLECRG